MHSPGENVRSPHSSKIPGRNYTTFNPRCVKLPTFHSPDSRSNAAAYFNRATIPPPTTSRHLLSSHTPERTGNCLNFRGLWAAEDRRVRRRTSGDKRLIYLDQVRARSPCRSPWRAEWNCESCSSRTTMAQTRCEARLWNITAYDGDEDESSPAEAYPAWLFASAVT